MEQYISKSDLVAEMKRRIKYNHKIAYKNSSPFAAGREVEGKDILSFIDTLAVKEAGISIPNIDDIIKKEGLDPDSKEAKMFKQSYYKAIDLYLTKVQKED